MSVAVDEGLSKACREDIGAAFAFLNSEERERYSAQRIDNDLGDIRRAAQEGKRILEEHGRELLHGLIEPMIRTR